MPSRVHGYRLRPSTNREQWSDQYVRDGVLRQVMDRGLFPNGIAVSPDNHRLAIGDWAAGGCGMRPSLLAPPGLFAMDQEPLASDLARRQGWPLCP